MCRGGLFRSGNFSLISSFTKFWVFLLSSMSLSLYDRAARFIMDRSSEGERTEGDGKKEEAA